MASTTALSLPATSPQRYSIAARVRERLYARRLDRELASGADPSASPELALRARRLCRPAYRTVIANGLEGAVAAADAGPRGLSAAAPVASAAVAEARPELEAVIAELRDAPEVNAQGVALARRLLTDAGGPLYAPGDAARLRRSAERALEALREWRSEP